jgi:SAM-dependent methyltransferase
MKWLLKSALQTILSHTPGGSRINAMWSRRKLLSQFDSNAMHQAIQHIQLLRRAGRMPDNAVVMEIGTGWKPIAPFVFRVAGAERLLLFDLNRHLDHELLSATVRGIRANLDEICASLDIAPETAAARFDFANCTFDEILSRSGLHYFAPFDVRATGLPGGSVDIVTSRSVLEHVPQDEMVAIFKEVRRVLKRDGAMVHTFDHSDHWQHFDPSIARMNYVRYSSRQWRLINNSLCYQNRMMSTQFLDLVRTCGFETVELETVYDPVAASELEKLKIHPDFDQFSIDEIAKVTTRVVAIPRLEHLT